MKSRLILPVLAILFSLALAACGLGASAATKPSASADPQKAVLEFTRCMRQHGVNLPDPGTKGGSALQLNVDPTTMEAAQNACRSKLKGAGLDNLSPAQRAQMQDQMIKFSECMRAHGINLPDPQFTGNGGVTRIGPDFGVDPNSAAFKAAQKACQSNLPTRGVTTTGSGSSSGFSGGQ